jgi:hypothetical protein
MRQLGTHTFTCSSRTTSNNNSQPRITSVTEAGLGTGSITIGITTISADTLAINYAATITVCSTATTVTNIGSNSEATKSYFVRRANTTTRDFTNSDRKASKAHHSDIA